MGKVMAFYIYLDAVKAKLSGPLNEIEDIHLAVRKGQMITESFQTQ